MELPYAKPIGGAILSLALLLAYGCTPRTKRSREAEAASLDVSPLAGGGVDIAFSLETPGQVSLAIFDGEGRLLRTLLSARPLTAGRHAMQWDGLDRDGQPAAPGEYSARRLQTGGLRSELVANVGVNPEPFWETGVGNHASPFAVAVDDKAMTLVPSVVEGGFTIARIRPDRSYAWAGVGAHGAQFDYFRLGATRRVRHSHHWGFLPCAAVTDGETILVLRNDGMLHRINRETGAVAGRPLPLHWPEEPEGKDAGGVGVGLSYLSLDAHDGIAVVSYRRDDALRWYNLASGEVLHEVTGIPAPTGVALVAANAALAISDGAVWRVRTDGEREVFIPQDALDAPWRLSVDREREELLVAENSSLAGVEGERHSIKRFDRDGQLLVAYGRPEGRQDGVYQATDFRHITDITATDDGGFVVAEPNVPPRRVARFNRAGELVMDFYGAVPYATSAAPEPDNPRQVWYSTASGLVRAAVDYESNQWRVLETYSETIRRNPLVELSSHMSKGLSTFSADGRLYVSTLGGTLFLYDPDRPSLRPVFAQGMAATDTERNRNPESHGWHLPPDLRAPGSPPYPIRTGYFWNDLDGDGLATREELSFYNAWQAGGPGGFVAFYKHDLTMVRSSGQIYVPTRITDDGVPVYDPTRPDETLPFGGGSHLYQADDGHWYRSYRAPLRGERHGIYWWPGLSATGRLVKYDAELQPVWAVGRHTATWDGEPGWQHGFEGIAGGVHDCIVVDGNFVDTESIGPMVYTEDGLFVDDLLIHPGGNFPEWVYYGSRHENPRGRAMRDPQTGHVLFFAHGNSSAPIFRIDGWDGWRRAESTFTLDTPAPHAAADGTGLQADYYDNPHWAGAPVVSRVDERVYVDWEKTPAGEGVPQRGFSARWTGVVEAPLSETFMLVLRTGTNHRSLADSPVVRLWINGEKLVDSSEMLGYEPRNYNRGYWRAPAPMQAGGRYAIRLEYGDRGGAGPRTGEANYLHLCWESPSVERQSIETRFLHPDAELADTGVGVASPGGDPRHAGRLLPVASKQPQTVDADGLIAHLRFDESQGMIAASEINPGVYGTLHGRTAWIEGQRGNALRFDGGMASLSPELRMPHSDYTIAFWFRSEETRGRLVSVNRKPTFHNNYHENRIDLVDGAVNVWLASQSTSTERTYADGQWHHLVMVVEKGEGHSVFIDGERVIEGEKDRMGVWHLWHVPTERLGMRVGPGDGTSAVDIDDLRIWKRPLSAAETTAIFTDANGG